MGSFEDNINNLTEAATGLTTTVGDKIGEINTRVEAAQAEVTAFIAEESSHIPQINLMPHSGRFTNPGNHVQISASNGFEVVGQFFPPVNGATVADAGKFIHDNTTYGGDDGPLDQNVIDLLTTIDRSSSGNRFGVEFHIAEFTQGAGTQHPEPTTGFPLVHNPLLGVSGVDQTATYACWIRAMNADVLVNEVAQVDGAPFNGNLLLTPAMGWTHIIRHPEFSGGYSHIGAFTFAVEDTRFQIALPVALPGRHVFPPHTAPVISAPSA